MIDSVRTPRDAWKLITATHLTGSSVGTLLACKDRSALVR